MEYRPQIIVSGILFLLIQHFMPGNQDAMAFVGGMLLSFGVFSQALQS